MPSPRRMPRWSRRICRCLHTTLACAHTLAVGGADRPLRFVQLKEEVEAQHDEIMSLARVTAGPIHNGRPNPQRPAIHNGRPNP